MWILTIIKSGEKAIKLRVVRPSQTCLRDDRAKSSAYYLNKAPNLYSLFCQKKHRYSSKKYHQGWDPGNFWSTTAISLADFNDPMVLFWRSDWNHPHGMSSQILIVWMGQIEPPVWVWPPNLNTRVHHRPETGSCKRARCKRWGYQRSLGSMPQMGGQNHPWHRFYL